MIYYTRVRTNDFAVKRDWSAVAVDFLVEYDVRYWVLHNILLTSSLIQGDKALYMYYADKAAPYFICLLDSSRLDFEPRASRLSCL